MKGDNRIVITGIGPLTAGGSGKDEDSGKDDDSCQDDDSSGAEAKEEAEATDTKVSLPSV